MKIIPIETGYFKLDGGAMFGIVPRRLWSKMLQPDEQNLCTWAMRCLLVDTGAHVVLIDTGIGDKQDEKFRSHFFPHGDVSLFSSLEKAGYAPEDITDVMLTHLHFDHCGGAVKINQNGEAVPTFPNATYWSTQKHWDWAMQPNAREAASFLKENFVPLQKHGVLKFVPQEQMFAWLPEISIMFCNGHTEAMMVPVIYVEGRPIVFSADTMPSVHHIGMPYVMAYDIRPLDSLQEKEQILNLLVENNGIIIFEHDSQHECATVIKDEKGRIKADRVGQLADILGA